MFNHITADQVDKQLVKKITAASVQSPAFLVIMTAQITCFVDRIKDRASEEQENARGLLDGQPHRAADLAVLARNAASFIQEGLTPL